jgi:hypothetical protein
MSPHLSAVYFSRWFLMPHLDAGVTVTTCMEHFVTNGDYTESEVWDAIHSLVNDGHIFETSQKHTFQHSGSTDLREKVLHFIKEQGTGLHCVHLFVMSVSTFYHKSNLLQTTRMKNKGIPVEDCLGLFATIDDDMYTDIWTAVHWLQYHGYIFEMFDVGHYKPIGHPWRWH